MRTAFYLGCFVGWGSIAVHVGTLFGAYLDEHNSDPFR